MRDFYELSISSALGAPAERVWAHATTMSGVNRELFPFLRMTYPSRFEVLRADAIVPGQRVFRSWILAFGVLPVDFDDLTFEEVGPGRRFLEHSRLGSQREWIHERIVESTDFGCVISDRVRFAPRLRWLGGFHRFVFGVVFRLRHRSLTRLFSAPVPSVSNSQRSC